MQERPISVEPPPAGAIESAGDAIELVVRPSDADVALPYVRYHDLEYGLDVDGRTAYRVICEAGRIRDVQHAKALCADLWVRSRMAQHIDRLLKLGLIARRTLKLADDWSIEWLEAAPVRAFQRAKRAKPAESPAAELTDRPHDESELTTHERWIADALRRADRGRKNSDLMRECGLNRRSVWQALASLERRGIIARAAHGIGGKWFIAAA